MGAGGEEGWSVTPQWRNPEEMSDLDLVEQVAISRAFRPVNRAQDDFWAECAKELNRRRLGRGPVDEMEEEATRG